VGDSFANYLVTNCTIFGRTVACKADNAHHTQGRPENQAPIPN